MPNASQEYARKKAQRAMATVCVHNPTDQDVTFWNDKFGPTARKIQVPAVTKDIGFGKGNLHIYRHLAERYTEDCIVKEINEISAKDWEKKKAKYRTLDEQLQHAERVQIRTNDAKLWNELAPKYWKGVVAEFSGEEFPDPEEDAPVNTGNTLSDVLSNSGLADKPYEPEV